MKTALFDSILIVTYSPDDIAKMLSDKTGVPVECIKCGSAELRIELQKSPAE